MELCVCCVCYIKYKPCKLSFLVHRSMRFVSQCCLQASVDSVEALIKKHSDLEGTSVTHEERTRALSDQANRLVHAGHYATAR